MMRCTEVELQFDALLEERLAGAERLAVDRHVAECDRCRAALEAHERLRRVLRAARPPDPPPGFWTAYRAGLQARMRVADHPAAGRPRWLGGGVHWWVRPAWAVALVLLVAATWWGWPRADRQEQSPLAAETYSNSLEFFLTEHEALSGDNLLIRSFPASEGEQEFLVRPITWQP